MSIGVSEIDEDHKYLIQCLNDIRDMMLVNSPQTADSFRDLMSAAGRHFVREEAVMAVLNFPFREQHSLLHETILRQLNIQLAMFEEGKLSPEDLLNFVNTWFYEHVIFSDIKISRYADGKSREITHALRDLEPIRGIKNAPRVYVLDDDPQYASLLAEIAANAGYNVKAESNPVAFLEYNLNAGDILVLDLNMPEMDGIEVIHKLAERDSRVNLVIISGFDDRVLHSARQLAEAHNIKVSGSLTKPVGIKEFIAVLNSIHSDIPEAVDAGETISQKPVTVNIPQEELRAGIAGNELVLYYQPQVDFKSGELTGVEALVRWVHPERGLLFPDSFISIAEGNRDLIDMLTENVVFQAAMQEKNWREQGIHLPVSVNMSARNLSSLDLPEKLINRFNENRLDSENIILEITESTVLGDLTSSLNVLNRLRMKGFSLSIDDFGTGFSSLAQLYQAPFAELKIDRNFVRRLGHDKEAEVIVKICIMLGHMLGMKVVAEGVETEENWNSLKGLDCDVAQGYYIARPMPVEEFAGWLGNSGYRLKQKII